MSRIAATDHLDACDGDVPVLPDLDALFARYATRYMAGDAGAVADLYGAPCLAIRSGAVIPLADRSAVVEHLEGLMAAYRAAGAAMANIMSIEVLPQGDAALLATVHWDIRTASGSLVRDFRTSYQLAGDVGWRIVSYVNHDFIGLA